MLNIRDAMDYKFHIVQNGEVNTSHLQHYIFKCFINEQDLNMPYICDYLTSYILYFTTLLEGTSNQFVVQTIENLINTLKF